MTVPVLLAAGLLLAAGDPAAAPAAKTIDPGYWSFSLWSVLAVGKRGRQCVRADQIDDFLAGPHNKHYTCAYPVRALKDGDATLAGECVSDKGERYSLGLKGRYSADRLDLAGQVRGRFLGLDVALPITIEARRLSPDCPDR